MAGWKFYINSIKVSEPIGWDAIEFTAKRLESHGIDQPFTTEISFIGKGAKILKGFFESGFINDDITFRITSDQNVDGEKYDFNGFINMALYSEKNTCDTQGWEISVGIIENSFKETFLNRQDVEIDLLTLKDLNQNVIIAISFDTVRLHSQQLYLQAFSKQLAETIFPATSTSDEDCVWPLYWDNSDFQGVFGSTKNPTGLAFSSTNVYLVNNADYTRTFKLNGYLKCEAWNLPLANDMTIRFVKYSSLGVATVLADFAYTSFLAFEKKIMQAAIVDFVLVLNPGERFQILQYLTTADDRFRVVYFSFPDENYLKYSELNQVQASTTKGLYIFNLLKRTLQIITGQSEPLISDYFAINTGLMWNFLLTTGLYIRNGQLIDQANPQIPVSFSKLFEALSRIFVLGWDFEFDNVNLLWKIRIEPLEYFYNTNLKTGEFKKASDITQFAKSTDLVNSVQIGFTDKWKNIAVSGIFEPHTYRTYFIPNKSRSSDVKVLDLRSEIIASGYAIEFSRRLQYLKDDSGSSDRPNDYNLIIIWLNKSVVTINPIEGTGYELPGQIGSASFAPGTVSVGSDLVGTTNAPIKSIYNIILSPARIAARYWKLLGMNTYGLTPAKASLFFQAGEYYTSLISQINDAFYPILKQEIVGAVSEKTDISALIVGSGFAKYLFKPIGLEFSFPQDLCSFVEMSKNGYGIIKVTSGKQTFYGYLMDATNKPTDPNSGITNFKLILANNFPISGFSKGFSKGFQ